MSLLGNLLAENDVTVDEHDNDKANPQLVEGTVEGRSPETDGCLFEKAFIRKYNPAVVIDQMNLQFKLFRFTSFYTGIARKTIVA